MDLFNDVKNYLGSKISDLGHAISDIEHVAEEKLSTYSGKTWRVLNEGKNYLRHKIGDFIHSVVHRDTTTNSSTSPSQDTKGKMREASSESWSESKIYSSAEKTNDIFEETQDLPRSSKEKVVHFFGVTTVLDSTASTLESDVKRRETLLPIHMGLPATRNTNQATFESLVEHYSSHPQEAEQALKSTSNQLMKLQAQMKVHYSDYFVTLLGRDALNRMLITDTKFSPLLTNPKVLQGLAALAALKKQNLIPKKFDIINSLGSSGQTMTAAFAAAMKIHPSSLMVIPPNGMIKDPNPLQRDSMRRTNLAHFQAALNQAVPKEVHVSPSPVGASRWDLGYNKEEWKSTLHSEFSQMCANLSGKSVQEFKQFVDPTNSRPDLSSWVEEVEGKAGGRGVNECRKGLEFLISGALPTGSRLEDFTKEDLISHLADSSVWQDPQVGHFCLDRLHFGGILMFNEAIQFQLKDDQISGADIIKGVVDRLKESGITEQNAVAGEALFARLAIITDTGILSRST
jgi:hypothetical protein